MSPAARKRQKAARRAAAEEATAAVANVAPITAGSGPLHTSAETLKALRQNKHNPLPYLKPDMLSRALEAFEHGRIREAVLLWEKMAERDDMISNVKPKREKDVSQLDMQVVVSPDSGAAGEAHKATLQKFWKSVRAVNAYDRNERGGFRRLVKQMMTATSFKYAAHHIIWQPRPDGELRATFEFVPLWLFENTTGKLRYLKSPSALSGEMLDDSEWMVTVGDGLMIACSIGYLAKRSAFNDWLIFSEKFSVPGVLGRTSAAAGSPEAQAMEEAVQAFGHDWCAVITGDDGTHTEPIKIIQAEGNPAGMPMPAVIERVDQRIAGLYRGADRSSMSSGSNGQSFGASMQEKETDILRRDDAETIAETLEEVSRLVIEWHYGNGVEPLARVELVVPVAEDASKVVEGAAKLADRGAKVSKSALMDRLNLPVAKDDADALQADRQDPQTPEARIQRPGEEIQNALPGYVDESWESELQDLRNALAEDMKPLADALMSAYQSGDYAALQGGLKKVSALMPELAGDADNLTGLLGASLAAAFLGDGEEVENAGNSDGAVKGWETRRKNGWQARPKATDEELASLIDDALDNKADPADRTATYGDVTESEAGLLGLPQGYRHCMSRHGIRHMMKSHGDAAREEPRGQIAITRDDIRNIPTIIANSQHAQRAGRNVLGLETIRYFYDGDDGTTTVLEEVRTGRKSLVAMQMIKFKKQGLRNVPNRTQK